MAGVWAGGTELGEHSPEVRCPGGLPAAAANVSTLRGRAAHRGKEGSGSEWGKGEPSHCTPHPTPVPPGEGILSACQSPFCLPTSLSGVGAVTLSPAFSF